MRPLLFWLVAPIAVVSAGCKSGEASASEPVLRDLGADGPGIAVVELFTSEGCSSCPSADAVLGELAAEGNPRVYPLAFQVDYWNSIGWTDPYSTELATQRQREYAASFATSSIFTPQMVVGGVDAFVGSDRGQAHAAIARALGRPVSTHLGVVSEAGDGATVRVTVHLEPALPDALVHVAIVERGLVSHVASGENAGKLLHHENVVRAFSTTRARGADVTTTLSVPAVVDRAHADVIAFVQVGAGGAGTKGMPVLGAARAHAPGLH